MEYWVNVDNMETQDIFDQIELSYDIKNNKNNYDNDEYYVVRIKKSNDFLINVKTRFPRVVTKEYEGQFTLKDIQKNFPNFKSIEELKKELSLNILKCKFDFSNCFKDDKLNLTIPLLNNQYTSISLTLAEKKKKK